jgi:orotidine-5'-phosphate decarboxylase
MPTATLPYTDVSSSKLDAVCDRLIVALDFPSAASALQLVDRLEGRVSWFKVGLELYLAAGPSIVNTLRSRGFQVFVDLKLHDIPNTVAGAVHSLASCGASLLTVHAGGGRPMLLSAVEAAERNPDGPGILAVTVLTSMDAEHLAQTGVPGAIAPQVQRLAELAASTGVAGMVCSPLEVVQLRFTLGTGPLLVVPGIRPTGTSADDQSRIATPAAAIRDGASYLVVGRPIAKAPDPAAVTADILHQIEQALPPNLRQFDSKL